MEVRKKVETYQVDLYCEVCHEKMVEKEDDCDPEWYTYYCENCGANIITKQKYPFIEYKGVNNGKL